MDKRRYGIIDIQGMQIIIAMHPKAEDRAIIKSLKHVPRDMLLIIDNNCPPNHEFQELRVRGPEAQISYVHSKK